MKVEVKERLINEYFGEVANSFLTYDQELSASYLDFQKIANSIEAGDGRYVILLRTIESILEITDEVDVQLEIFNLLVWAMYMEINKFFQGAPAFEGVITESFSTAIKNISSEALLNELFMLEEYFETFTFDTLPEQELELEQFNVSFLAIFYAYTELLDRSKLLEYRSESLIMNYLKDIHAIAEYQGKEINLQIDYVVEDIRRRLLKKAQNS